MTHYSFFSFGHPGGSFMSNSSDYLKFSDFIEAVTDPKIRSLAVSFTTSVSFLKQQVTLAKASADASALSADHAHTSEVNTAADVVTTHAVLNDINSRFLGTLAADPQTAAGGLPVNPNALYLRSTDSHLRYVNQIANGQVTWRDALVSVDVNSVYAAGDARYLMLSKNDFQHITTAVVFDGEITVCNVTNWQSNQAAPAAQVKLLVDQEATRANQAISDAIAANTTHNDQTLQNAIGFEVKRSNNAIDHLVPPGCIMLYYGITAPDGWAPCNGTVYNRVDGTGQIASPDLRDRVVVGAGGSHNVGDNFGQDQVTVDTTTNPSNVVLNQTNASNTAGGGSGTSVITANLVDNQHHHSVTVDVHQPSLALLYIIKL
jgi:hypothetical protein